MNNNRCHRLLTLRDFYLKKLNINCILNTSKHLSLVKLTRTSKTKYCFCILTIPVSSQKKILRTQYFIHNNNSYRLQEPNQHKNQTSEQIPFNLLKKFYNLGLKWDDVPYYNLKRSCEKPTHKAFISIFCFCSNKLNILCINFPLSWKYLAQTIINHVPLWHHFSIFKKFQLTLVI